MFEKLGKFHSYWLKNPGVSAMIGFFYILFLCFYALSLGIAFDFGASAQYKGFISSLNWGPSYLLGIPLIIYVVALLFRLLNDALLSLDDILLPQEQNAIPFSIAFFNRFGRAWKRYFVPVSVIISVGVVLAADFTGIFSPTGLFRPTVEHDWTSVGYIVYSNTSWVFFLLFNLLAYLAEGLFAYIAAITILSLAYPLYIFVQPGISVRSSKRLKGFFVNKYILKWKFDDAHGRCGLHKLDRVFITYVGIIGIAILLAIISVLKNANTTGIDIGSLILIAGVGLLLPLSFVWIILPYWIKFPSKLPPKEKLPPELRDISLPDPKPWPLGSEKISWGFLAFVSSGWIYLMKLGWNYIVKRYLS